jgi:hypothetical protein
VETATVTTGSWGNAEGRNMRVYKVEGNRVAGVEDNITFEDFCLLDNKKALEWAINKYKANARSAQREIDKLAERRKILVDEINQTVDDIFRLQEELEELG